MRLADYFKQSVWAGLDKSLTVIYGLGFLFAVVRVLPQEQFGLLILFQSVFYFFEMVDNTLVQIPTAKFLSEGKQAGWAIPTSFLLSLIVLLFAGFVSLVGAPWLAELMKAPNLAGLLALMPLMLSSFYLKNLTSPICIANHWTARLFFIDAIYFLGSLIFLFAAQAIGALSDARQVIWINISTAFAASLLGVISTWELLRQTRWHLSLNHFSNFINFAKYSGAVGVGNYFYSYFDAFLIGYFYGPIQVGIYNAGKIIFRFYNVVSQATQVVLLPLISRLSASGQKGELRALAEKAICFLFLALLPLHLLLFVGADVLLETVYHGKYGEAGWILRVLVLGAVFVPWGAVGSNMQLGMGQPQVSLLFVISVAIFGVIANLIFLPVMGVMGAAIATTLMMIFGAVLQIFYMRHAFQLRFRGIWQRRLDALDFGRALWARFKATV
jgi:O-antigen/teichoic acid export membrane protein